MSSDYFERQVVTRRRFTESMLKVRAAFVTVFCKHKALADSLPEGEREKHTDIMDLMHKILKGMDISGWPTIYISQVLDRRSSEYRGSMDAFSSLEIKTFIQFCSCPLSVIKVRFNEHGVKLPDCLEELYLAYRKQNQG